MSVSVDSDQWTFQRRPWGWMVKLWHTQHLWIKFIRVYTRNSVQSHDLREEYHISLFRITHIKKSEIHRMTRGWYLEIATGTPLESDIKRYEDDFGRATR